LFEDVTEQSFVYAFLKAFQSKQHAEQDKVIAVNFKGAYFTIQKALPLLRQGSSVIINNRPVGFRTFHSGTRSIQVRKQLIQAEPAPSRAPARSTEIIGRHPLSRLT
jgi:hypothetical protein